MLDILYEDSDLLVLNKPPGQPVQADKTGDPSLLEIAEARCKQSLFLAHRIDRPVSGILVLARNKRAAAHLQRQLVEHSADKQYLAVVGEAPPAPSGRLEHFLKKNGAKNSSQVVEADTPGASHAVLDYRLLGSSDRYHLLLVRLHTGRHHQIRAQLAAIGCPVKGDVKYGARRSNRDRSIHLHAWRLEIEHPSSGGMLRFEAPPPTDDVVWSALQTYLPDADQWTDGK